ncbi:FecR family protein [Proteiniphilum sp. UBA5384]|uniref:FecR family protein n=1 Tax=Proteiniphilum sp. UBA5384 TaxID=1947279 RepID=UPI0025F05DFD|nr:FecR family protein [Proteiniphilum sp. UBA5384]MDD4632381.1 FecR domain-containing protein [Proteiniphilum sp.]
MERNNICNSYTDLLKDQRFLQWQLMSDETMNSYWKEFFFQHPELKNELLQAIHYLKKEGLNKSSLNDDERMALFERIQISVNRKKKKKIFTLIGYASAVAVVALIILGIKLFSLTPESLVRPDKEIIIGEVLNNKDIQLITSGKTISFDNDVEVSLNDEGTVEVTQRDNDVTRLAVNHDQINSLIVPFGKRSTLRLADGTKVWLNSGSVLEFPTQFSGKNREIKLASGEMYIEVAHDKEKPFYVHTPDFKLRVYGTKFNLSNYDNSPGSVVLVEGSVSVQSGTEEMFLNPNEQLLISRGKAPERQTVDVTHYISWKDGYLLLENTPMTDVLDKVERYYNLSFNYEQDVNLKKRTCSGKIYLSENLDNVMTTITLLSATQFKKENNRIYISHATE